MSHYTYDIYKLIVKSSKLISCYDDMIGLTRKKVSFICLTFNISIFLKLIFVQVFREGKIEYL